MQKLNQLAVNTEGFVFDPSSGESFTVNPVALAVLNGLRDGLKPGAIAKKLHAEFEGCPADVETDIRDFMGQLKNLKLFSTAK
jgi:PqqD family protein of HPr-rel-A system